MLYNEYTHEGLWKKEWWGGKGAFKILYVKVENLHKIKLVLTICPLPLECSHQILWSMPANQTWPLPPLFCMWHVSFWI